MTASPLDRFAEAFERLRQLAPAQRDRELAALDLEADECEQLRRMLAADAQDDDLLAQTVRASATRLNASQSQRIGPYRLLHELGAGGMGTVFLAERIEGGFTQQVAVKLLRGFPTRDGLRRLRQERQILAALEHPHIARLLDGGETADGQPWLALEYVDGLPLLQHAARHAPTLAQRLALFDHMLDAIGHAHRHLVVHRDLKPGNVLVTHAGEVKLLDFGIARLIDLDTQPAADATSTRVYSPGYASPEQLTGSAVTTASDIFALGILLRELLTAQRADGRPVADLVALPLDADLTGIIAKATELEAGRRYASTSEFADDLQRYRDNRPVRAARMTRWYRARKFFVRHRLGAAVVLGAVLILAGFVWRLDRERDRALAAEAASERDAASARAALQFLVDTLGAAAPDVAQSRTVSVRELLETARKRLDDGSLGADATHVVKTLLADVYADLGETGIALELFGQGLAGATPHSRDEALALSDMLDRHAALLAQVGKFPQSEEVARQSRQWRDTFSPDETEQQAKSLLTQAYLIHRQGDLRLSIAKAREAMQLSTPAKPLPAPLMLEIASTLAGMLTSADECEEANKVAILGLQYTQALAPDHVTRVPLLRAQANALRLCGKYAEAETTLRQTIALQNRVVGSGGVRMSALLNDLALTLNDMGRYREASSLLAQAERIGHELHQNPSEAAISLTNRAGILENVGDYAQALELQTQAQKALDEGAIDPAAFESRRIARNHARTLALAGQAPQAIERLTGLIADAQRLDGVDSSEYAMTTWQRAIAQRRAGRIGAALADADEAERRFAELVPHTHPFFAHVHRLRAALALQEADPVSAEREQLAAIKQLENAHGIEIDLAIARSELAEIQRSLGRRDDARATLVQALPTLRDALLPTEVARAAAERSATALGLPPASDITRTSP